VLGANTIAVQTTSAAVPTLLNLMSFLLETVIIDRTGSHTHC
jgi:hypothetical protein